MSQSVAFVSEPGDYNVGPVTSPFTDTSNRPSLHQSVAGHQISFKQGRSGFGQGVKANARKIFVGGVSKRDTTEETFTKFFEKYGEIEDVVLMKSKTGDEQHRGFGFVTFVTQESTDQVLAEAGSLEIDGRKVDVKMALPPSLKPPEGVQPNKIFIGSIPKENFSTQDLKNYFLQWGEIDDAFVMPGRGFGFVTYSNANSAFKALIHGCNFGHVIRDNIHIDAKWPRPREQPIYMARSPKPPQPQFSPYGYTAYAPAPYAMPYLPPLGGPSGVVVATHGVLPTAAAYSAAWTGATAPRLNPYASLRYNPYASPQATAPAPKPNLPYAPNPTTTDFKPAALKVEFRSWSNRR